MKLKTLNALIEYIRTVEKTIKTVASLGPGTDFIPLGNATADLYDAIENEDVSDHQNHP